MTYTKYSKGGFTMFGMSQNNSEPVQPTIAQKLDYLKVSSELAQYYEDQARRTLGYANSAAFQGTDNYNRLAQMEEHLSQLAKKYRELEKKIRESLALDMGFQNYAESMMPGFTQAVVAVQPVQEQQSTHHM